MAPFGDFRGWARPSQDAQGAQLSEWASWAPSITEPAKECKGSTLRRVHSLLPLDDSAPSGDAALRFPGPTPTPDVAAAASRRRSRRQTVKALEAAGWTAAEVAAELAALEAVRT